MMRIDPLTWSLIHMEHQVREVALKTFEKWNVWIDLSHEDELEEEVSEPDPCQVWDWEQIECELKEVGHA
jgi:hypothetical protein